MDPTPITDQFIQNTRQLCLRQRIVFDIDGVPSPIPMTLFPSRLPKEQFYLAKLFQPFLNLFMVKMAHDYRFLTKSLETVVQVDPICQKLYDIYKLLYLEPSSPQDRNHSRYSLGLFRTDYFLDRKNALKLIEINTISISFFGLSNNISEFHHYMEHRHSSKHPRSDSLPLNESVEMVSDALFQAHCLYLKNCAKFDNDKLAILILVEDKVTNLMDQYEVQWKLESMLTENGSGREPVILRETFRTLDGRLSLDPDSKALLLKIDIDHFVEISVVYYRTGYVDGDYDERVNAWSTRLLIERSMAIKSPSVAIQLAGMKSLQSLYDQAFCRYQPDCPSRDSIIRTFTRFYPVNLETCEMIANGQLRCVLKSNQEGGGHNIFGDEIVPFIRKNLLPRPDHCKAYSLQEFIEQEAYPAYIINMKPEHAARFAILGKTTSRDGLVGPISITSEFGVFGSVLYDHQTEKLVLNECRGHLLRSKPADANEVGIVSGNGFLDSPFLV